MNLQVQQNNQTTLQYKWSNKVTYSLPQEAMVQLRSWMIPAETCTGTFVACGKTTTTNGQSISKQVTMQYAKGQKVAAPFQSEYLEP